MTFRAFLGQCMVQYSAVVSNWAGWALAQLEFGSPVNPITARGADYAHHITASPSGFENPAAALTLIFCKTRK